MTNKKEKITEENSKKTAPESAEATNKEIEKTTKENKISEEEMKKFLKSQEILHLNLGYILGLFSVSKYHAKSSIAQFMNSIIPAIKNNQFRLFFKGPRPIAFVSWALVSDEIAEKYKSGKYFFTKDDWKSGENIWIAEFVAPYSKEDRDMVIKTLKEKVFVDKTINVLARNPDGSVKEVMKNFES